MRAAFGPDRGSKPCGASAGAGEVTWRGAQPAEGLNEDTPIYDGRAPRPGPTGGPARCLRKAVRDGTAHSLRRPEARAGLPPVPACSPDRMGAHGGRALAHPPLAHASRPDTAPSPPGGPPRRFVAKGSARMEAHDPGSLDKGRSTPMSGTSVLTLRADAKAGIGLSRVNAKALAQWGSFPAGLGHRQGWVDARRPPRLKP